MQDNIQRGEYLVGDKVRYFRSKWEANYALYLDYQKKQGLIDEWFYEPEWFDFTPFGVKHGATRYLPDFKVLVANKIQIEFHEVKGVMTGRARQQIKYFKKFFPQYKHVLIEQDFFRAIKKQHLDKLLKFY